MPDQLISPPRRPRTAAQSFAGYAIALLLVALSTVLGLVIDARWNSSPVDMLYLLPVLVAAIYFGLGPGLVAAAASALAFNYYFTAPLHTFVIHSPADVVTVIMLFAVAAACSQLAASVSRHARIAEDHAARNATIAGFARRLLSAADEAEVSRIAVSQMGALFDCHAAYLTGSDEAQVMASVPDNAAPSPGDLAAATYTLQAGEASGRGQKRVPQADWQFHPVSSDKEVLAAIGLAREDGTPPVADDRKLLFENLLGQIALALSRTRLEGEARDVAALRARDQLRSALLLSIGDDIKPRLKAASGAARALRREGTGDRKLVAEVEGELGMIERQIDNLVDVSPGDVAEAVAIGPLSIDLHRRVVMRGAERVHLPPKEFGVLAELTKHAGRVLTHAQLLRAVWGPAQADHVDYLRVAVRNLRQKLEEEPSRPVLIVNEPGVGYRLVP